MKNKMQLDPATMAAVVSEIKKLGLDLADNPLAMAEQDPLIRATKKAYRGSKTFQIDRLLAERSRWSRKVTIASNKLADVNAAIVDLCKELASDADKKGLPHETKTSETPAA